MRPMAFAATSVLACAASAAAAQDLNPVADQLNAAAFAPSALASGVGVVRWRDNQVSLATRTGAVDTIKVTLGEVRHIPGGMPLPLEGGQWDVADYEATLTRTWPGAVSFDKGKLGVEFSPHAGLGVGREGGSAEAGAMISVGQRRDRQAQDAMRSLGVTDGTALGGQGRFYLYAAASGRAVGLNVLRDGNDWGRAGWTTDPTSALIGDAQVGVGYRRGPMQGSFGYIHREVKGEHMIFGQKTHDDSLVALSFTIKPGGN